MAVAIALIVWIGQFGPPKILQYDNGNEFKGEVIRIMESYGITLIHGCPWHPQTQGLIERTNAILKQKIRTAKVKIDVNQWRQFLPYGNLSNESTGIHFLYSQNFIIKLIYNFRSIKQLTIAHMKLYSSKKYMIYQLACLKC